MEIFWTKVKDIIKETSEINTYILECPKEFT
ncbi:hypothetical protein DFR54_10382 [Vagococcus fluvialis]|nr:hypothetical protein DFR54_10382 [Vagococcus fluvialis]